MTTVRDNRVRVAVTLWMCAVMVGGAIHGLWHVHAPADVTGAVIDCDHSCADPAHGHERHPGHDVAVDRCPLCAATAAPALLSLAPPLVAASRASDAPVMAFRTPWAPFVRSTSPRAPPLLLV